MAMVTECNAQEAWDVRASLGSIVPCWTGGNQRSAGYVRLPTRVLVSSRAHWRRDTTVVGAPGGWLMVLIKCLGGPFRVGLLAFWSMGCFTESADNPA
jgi:hypothetical protein